MTSRITLRFDLGSQGRIGHGKIALLEAIGTTGSISAAGREYGMSYRRAWLLVEEMNGMFDQPVVETRNGGLKGGGAELTARGQHLVRVYRETEELVAKQARSSLRELERWLAPATDAETPTT
ncbi:MULTISPECIES: winged helix-turn-helix domain-containing protein [unclassified Aureimonas]|uniref:winged helix-turn-helix domain-containing protein n=1 Tax=unclassified Aureimonas TaxID=2615206 RepID=UPI0007847D5C|nr:MULTISPECIES: winged helix-turn-helix domain-containing protein [unclassified Aureimonas]